MIDIKVLLLGLLSTGCIHAGKDAITFNPANSVCIDSLVSNMQIAGCDVISVEENLHGISVFSCHSFDKQHRESSWIKSEFYAIAFGASIPDDATPICTDPFVILTTNE